MNDKDVRIETFRSGPLSPVAVRVTHLPTGLSVKVTGASSISARRRATKKLEELVAHSLGVCSICDAPLPHATDAASLERARIVHDAYEYAQSLRDAST